MSGHVGTLTKHGRLGIVDCSCGQSFEAVQHEVELDVYDSPAWEQHVQEATS